MCKRICFLIVVFSITAALIFTVFLRNAGNRIAYELYVTSIEHNRLKQQLWEKQLRVEGIINPAAVSERLGEEIPKKEEGAKKR